MNDEEILGRFYTPLIDFDDIGWLIAHKPLLAHYTTISALEKILKCEEIWLSNPLFMNDLQEVKFGMNEGLNLFLQNQMLEVACTSAERTTIARQAFYNYYNDFDANHLFDTYVFCLTRHDPTNDDGLLSMWRGYGGQGNGAALVFNTNFITKVDPQSPLLIAKVHYASSKDRIGWLENKLGLWCDLLRTSDIPDEKLQLAVWSFFTLVKIFALVSKHDGFKEEEEWRIIYMPERDPHGILKSRYHYVIGKRGVEPKLRLAVKPLSTDSTESWTFDDILDRIILGPSISSPLAVTSVNRMLENIGKMEFRQKVRPSTIPLRPA
jgi:hypothetical protein